MESNKTSKVRICTDLELFKRFFWQKKKTNIHWWELRCHCKSLRKCLNQSYNPDILNHLNTQSVLKEFCCMTTSPVREYYRSSDSTLQLPLWPPGSAVQPEARSSFPGRTSHQTLLSTRPGDLHVIDQSAVIMLLTAQSPILILVYHQPLCSRAAGATRSHSKWTLNYCTEIKYVLSQSTLRTSPSSRYWFHGQRITKKENAEVEER